MESRYIKTHRSRDVKKSILFVSKKILEALNKNSSKKLNDVFIKVQEKLQIKEKDFMLTLTFLFALGVIEYNQKRDMLAYRK